MPEFNEDKERQVVPRWRAFTAAAHFGELIPLAERPLGAFTADMLYPLLDDWRQQPSLSVAADVVSTAFVIGHPALAQDAARFVLADEKAPTAAREVALRCLPGGDSAPSILFTENYSVPLSSGMFTAIRTARRRLGDFPINPVLWTNLSLLYTTLGQQEKAHRAMLVALQLAPESRFVVRAACRLFLHQGDFDRAHSVLLRTASLKSDPWILAGEVAVAAIRKRSSRFVKRARNIAESQNYSPFHLSELLGALATIEACDGAIKKAKRLCALSLADPSENAVAQAAWLGRQLGVASWTQAATTEMQSSEANAWRARIDGKWTIALSEAIKWQADQPFSSRPAVFGGYVASTALDKFGQAEQILRQGLQSNRDDATLYNNLAFALAKQDKVSEAEDLVAQGFRMELNASQRVCLTATRGLVEFRSGRSVEGRASYRKAIAMASAESIDQLRHIAIIYHAIEEMRIGSADAIARRNEALQAVEELPTALRSVFSEKLRKAEVDFFQLHS